MTTLQRLRHRGRTTLRILRAFVFVRRRALRVPLPELVQTLGSAPGTTRPVQHPATLGRAVAAVLRIGPIRARCLVTSLVLYRLLHEEGYEPELVIGMPAEADTPMAHAWVEVRGHDVGPPPGRGQHVELMRLS